MNIKDTIIDSIQNYTSDYYFDLPDKVYDHDHEVLASDIARKHNLSEDEVLAEIKSMIDDGTLVEDQVQVENPESWGKKDYDYPTVTYLAGDFDRLQDDIDALGEHEATISYDADNDRYVIDLKHLNTGAGETWYIDADSVTDETDLRDLAESKIRSHTVYVPDYIDIDDAVHERLDREDDE